MGNLRLIQTPQSRTELGEGSRRVYFVAGKFAFQFYATKHFSDDDVCSTACAIVFAEEVWRVDAKSTTAILGRYAK